MACEILGKIEGPAEAPYMPASFIALCEEIRGLKLEIKINRSDAQFINEDESQ